jgi:serine/threonine-protein kinase
MTDSTAWEDIDAALGDDYIIVRESPQAAGFTSFSARSKRDGSSVEIKTVPGRIFGGDGPLKETDFAARKLQHPNILPLVTYGFAGDTFFWISPAVEGRTLRSRLARGGRIDINDSLTVLRDVSAALTHAHLHGVVHGGLTPDSVIISGGSALVCDLGIPEVFSALRRSGRTIETAHPAAVEPLRYASPEQAAGNGADARSDVYAWGVVAYEVLGGRHPFAGRTTPRQMMAAHTDEEPVQLQPAPGNAPGSVTRLVMRCLSKDPSKRPESAREIFAALTKELLVPPPAPKAGTGQRVVVGVMILIVLMIVAISWLGMRSD